MDNGVSGGEAFVAMVQTADLRNGECQSILLYHDWNSSLSTASECICEGLRLRTEPLRDAA